MTDAADEPSWIRTEELIVVIDSSIGFLVKLERNIKWDEKC